MRLEGAAWIVSACLDATHAKPLKPNLDRKGRLGSDEWGSMKVDENKEASPTGVITRAEERPNLKNFEREIAFRHQELKPVPS
jgi:hypothetical protein